MFCLSNKSTPVTRPRLSLSDIANSGPMIWHFETKGKLAEGEYTFSEKGEGAIEKLKKIAVSIFGSLAFDGLILPTMVEAQNALRTNNRRSIYEAFKKLKIGNDKEGFLKFYVKKSKTGKNLIVFKGYSGLRGFLTSTKYGVNHLKVGMIASSSSVYVAATTAGLRSAVSSTVKAAGKSLGDIPILGGGSVSIFID